IRPLRRRRRVPQRGRHRLAGVAGQGARAQEGDEGDREGIQGCAVKPTGVDVAGLIAHSSPAMRRRDAETLTALMQEISGREPKTWGTIIGFGHCEYSYPTGRTGEM